MNNTSDSERIWRSGNILVIHRNTSLPDRCVKTNEPAQGRRLKRKLYWHHPALYFLILFNILVYAIIALAIRKKATIEIGVSEKALLQRKRAIITSWIMVLIGIGLVVLGLASGEHILVGVILWGVGVFFVGLLWAAVKVPLVSAKRIETDYVWIKGVCEEYLTPLSEWEKR